MNFPKTKVGFFMIVLLVLSQQTLWAQNNSGYAASLIPEELLKGAHTVVRNEDYVVDIPDYDEIIVNYKTAVTLLNDNSDANELILYYNSFKKINRIKGRIYDAEGNLVRELKKGEIEDWSTVSGSTMYADSRAKVVKVNHSDYPYTIEWEYKQTSYNYMFYPGWVIQDFGVSVEKAAFTVLTRDKKNLNYKSVNIDLDPTAELHKNQIAIRWAVSRRPAIKKVSYSPPSQKILPRILLSPNRFKLGKHEGSMASWQSFGVFMHQLNEGRDILSKEMAEKVKSLTASAQTDREKIDILYRYLQENTRYISVQLGVGGWQTFDADYVEKNKYGDCKALTHFMKAMLNSIDITANPVYIGSGYSDALITEDFVNPGFNHVILNVPSENYWLECTSSYSPPNYIGRSNSNRKALRVTDQGGELVRTPAIKPEESKIANQATIVLDENGNANIVNKVRYIGPQQDRRRYMTKETTKEEQQKSFLENCGLPSAFINKLETQVAEDKPEVHVDYDIDVAKYAAKSGKRFFVPINPINPFTSIPEKKERTRAIYFEQGYVFEDDLTFVLPAGYEVESMPPENILLESPYGKYTMDLITEGSKIKYKRRLEMLPLSLPAEEYQAFRNFRKEVAEMDAIQMVLVKKKT